MGSMEQGEGGALLIHFFEFLKSSQASHLHCHTQQVVPVEVACVRAELSGGLPGLPGFSCPGLCSVLFNIKPSLCDAYGVTALRR